MGMQPGTGMNFLQGGLSGLGQGLQNWNNPRPQFNFSNLSQGFQQNRQLPGPQDWAGQQNIPSKIKKPGAGPTDEDLFGSEQPDYSIGQKDFFGS